MAEWTPEEDATLHRLWMVEGLSASMCAARMPGERGRNSIIGRVHRLGWSRPLPSGPGNRLSYPKRAAPKKVFRRQKPAPAFVSPNWKDTAPVAPTRAGLRGLDIESPNAGPWIDRQAHQCAYPVSGEGADTFSCCNPSGDANYCPGHMAIMFNGFGAKPNVSHIDAPARQTARAKTFEAWLAA